MKLSGVKAGEELVTCEITVEAFVTAAAKVDGVVVNGALDSARDTMSSLMGSREG